MRVEQLRRRVYTLGFIDEFGPLYAVFTLWFNDHDVTTSQLSIAFLLWAATTIVFEIPSGALADRVDRRRLLAVAFALRAIGIAIWMLSPTFTGLMVGALLWAIHSSLASGAWEALIHDELSALDAEVQYANLMARVGQFSHLGVALAALVAAPLLSAGVGIAALGWVTVATHAVTITLVLVLPRVGEHDDDDDRSWSYAEWWRTLRDGVEHARRTPIVLRLVVVTALLEGLFVIDEYIPLLARQRGAEDALTPVVYFAVWAGLLVGGELAARRTALRGRTLGVLVIVGSVAMIVALQTDPIWTLALVGVGYAALEATWVLGDARLQELIPTATRATVTSVRSFNSGITSAVAFGVVGLMTAGDDPTPGLLVAIAILLATGALIAKWLPDRPQNPKIPVCV